MGSNLSASPSMDGIPSAASASRSGLRTQVRFAVGSRAGVRSTIWKAWIHGDEAYLATRMFGADVKVSFHSSGQCQWSYTDSWVSKQPNVRNADRHMVRWQVDQPTTDQALLLFRVEIPMSELRQEFPPKDKKKVFWVTSAPAESTVRFLLYLTRPSPSEPLRANSAQMKHLSSLRMRNERWLVIFVELISLSGRDIDEARKVLIADLIEAGIPPKPEHRAGLFIQPPSEGGAHGFLELCLINA